MIDHMVVVSSFAARAALIALAEAEASARTDAQRAKGFENYERCHEARADAFKRAADEIKNSLGEETK